MQKTITTFAELERYSRAFADGHFEVFLLVGDPGLEKSTLLRKALEGKQSRWIEGTLSAFQLYCETWEHKDHLFAIDDVDNLYGDRNAVRLLKCLCPTEPVKRLGWHTYAAKLVKDGIPREFGTKSPVAIIANEWKALNKNVGALQDRGILILFRPPAREVHERVGSWFTDGEIYEFIGGLLHLIASPSIRHYINCQRLKDAGLDWREALYESLGITDETLAVARLLDDESFASGEARVTEFVEQTGRSRATDFRIARKLRGCEPQEDRRDTTDGPRRLSAPNPGSDHPAPEQGKCLDRCEVLTDARLPEVIETDRAEAMMPPSEESVQKIARFPRGTVFPEEMKKLGDGTIDAVVATIDAEVTTLGVDYLDRCKRWMTEVQRVMTSNGSLFLNVEDSPSDPGISFAIADEAQKLGFHLQNRIAWVKSIRIDGEVHTVDHIKQVEGDVYCNITSEFVFHLTKTGNVELDRYCEGVGVPYADLSNLTRWKHKRTRKCRGNSWYVPRSELAEKLLLLIGIKPAQTVLECGDIGTAAACRKLGIECVSI